MDFRPPCMRNTTIVYREYISNENIPITHTCTMDGTGAIDAINKLLAKYGIPFVIEAIQVD